MSTVFFWILAVATIVGGIAAVSYFRDKWREKQQWVVEDKEVNSTWWESSELKRHYEAKSYKDFAWSNIDRAAERIVAGKEMSTSLIKRKESNTSSLIEAVRC